MHMCIMDTYIRDKNAKFVPLCSLLGSFGSLSCYQKNLDYLDEESFGLEFFLQILHIQNKTDLSLSMTSLRTTILLRQCYSRST